MEATTKDGLYLSSDSSMPILNLTIFSLQSDARAMIEKQVES